MEEPSLLRPSLLSAPTLCRTVDEMARAICAMASHHMH